ncbi:hypothetical protein HETIRDRAFT_412928 [Heterobasidion irregulare TC 32-1]|uniref:Uncharacterized protein n=1 Tax=Heterobasidion irregulare (strain TC 32-1) TaxID=747525 RepID=W4KKV7_HETIT|nr:uncharacterized protein HETIRDRAFT_412928 [Heterobasidion irregulare TC 32-1]ETW86488.1 hypothetical protein HETIRDRAFT_412928 [Heterobasidion irregulare TC 32-1]
MLVLVELQKMGSRRLERWHAHQRVDKNHAIIFPTIDMVHRLSKHKCSDDIHKIYQQEEVFMYHFLPLGEPTSNIIHYQKTDKGEQLLARDAAIELHLYPFHTLLSLRSHVEPHYVVINATQKPLSIGQGQSQMQLLRSIAAVYNMDLSAAQKFFIDIDLLYKAWKEPALNDFAIPKVKKEAQVNGNKGMEDAVMSMGML